MRLIAKMRKGYAVYWPPLEGTPQGQRRFGDPVEIRCRWTGQTGSPAGKAGTIEESMTEVYADRKLKILGVLWEGRLGALPPVADGTPPTRIPDAYEIRKFKVIRTLNYRNVLYIAYL